jgi:hypothetical protein
LKKLITHKEKAGTVAQVVIVPKRDPVHRVQWLMLVIPVTLEVDIGGSHLMPAWVKS